MHLWWKVCCMITLQEVLIQKEELVEPYRNKTDALASIILIIATLVFVLGHIAVELSTTSTVNYTLYHTHIQCISVKCR